MPYTAQNGHQPIQFSTALRVLSVTVSVTMALYLLLAMPVSPYVVAQRPDIERLATAEAQISELRDTVKDLRAMAQITENKINTISGVGTGAFATLAILDILQLLGAKRRSSPRNDA